MDWFLYNNGLCIERVKWFSLKVFQLKFNLLNAKVAIIETSQLIYRANQLTGFYMIATLAFNELNCSEIMTTEC